MIGALRFAVFGAWLLAIIAVTGTDWDHTHKRFAYAAILFVWAIVLALVEIADRLSERPKK